MRYEKGHKAETRQKILETASREFRRQGIDGVGLADIMSQAGLTHGGFYSHFASKDELIRESLGATMDPHKSTPFREEGRVRSTEEIIRRYLSPAHRDRTDRGCTAAALVEEVARQSHATRRVFTDMLNQKIADLATSLPAAVPAKLRRKKALSIFSTMMGALQLSRTVSDPEMSVQILESGIEASLRLTQA